jgi:hypothetical protein
MRVRLAVAVLCLVCPSCARSHLARDEVARVRSPSGRVDAVLVETNGGEGTDFAYLAYVVRSGRRAPSRGEVAWLSVAVRNQRAYGANLRWTGPATLSIEYLDAHGAERRQAQARLGPDTIAVVLRPGVFDSLAPPGSMLYNLQRARH